MEDETDILVVIEHNLLREGFMVSLATGGNSWLVLIQDEIPDLLLLDLMLPRFGGIKLC